MGRPDIYQYDMKSGAPPIRGVATSVGGFIGIAPRGTLEKPILVLGWEDFKKKFSLGLDTPFMKNSDLTYAVYGFFQNGGGSCYVKRVAGATAAKATITVPVSTGVAYTALDEGTWANTLKVDITANVDNATLFDIVLTLNGNNVDNFIGVSSSPTSPVYFVDVINNAQRYITVSPTGTLAIGSGTLTGGKDGIDDITDNDYIGDKGLLTFDKIDNGAKLLAIPGQTTKAIIDALTAYCLTRWTIFPILDCPQGSSEESVATFRKQLSGIGAIYYPWIKVVDPLSTTNKLRLTPPSGHMMGLYARTDNTRGIHKAPAGTEAIVLGAVELEKDVSPQSVEFLNPLSVNCIIQKSGYGVVSWGARTIKTDDPDFIYVGNTRLDMNIKESVYDSTQWAVFEPNDEKLWMKLTNSISDFLRRKWRDDGALKGRTEKQAFFVKCDDETNPDDVQEVGEVHAVIGYAGKKPAEFIVFNYTRKLNQGGNS
jgi:phage tail sheath protein FI